MSYDVLAELRRRLVGSTDTPIDERRSGEGADSGTTSPSPLLADGGDGPDEDDHLRDIPDGAGCTEIWEHLSERQADEAEAEERRPRECRADD